MLKSQFGYFLCSKNALKCVTVFAGIKIARYERKFFIFFYQFTTVYVMLMICTYFFIFSTQFLPPWNISLTQWLTHDHATFLCLHGEIESNTLYLPFWQLAITSCLEKILFYCRSKQCLKFCQSEKTRKNHGWKVFSKSWKLW